MPTAALAFAGGLSSVGDARRWLCQVLSSWQCDHYDFSAAQVLSELTTNAALHAHTAYTVALRLDDESLLIEVTDASARIPQPRRYAADATTGRGMVLVETLSASWGTTPVQGGKTVWARLHPDAPGDLMFDIHDFLDEEPAPRLHTVREQSAERQVRSRGLVAA